MGYNSYTPAETAELVSRAGVSKANMRIDKIFLSGVMAGMMLSFACASVLSTNTAPWYQANAPGLIRTIAALIFPYGLCMIVLTGSDLCTGSFLVCRRWSEGRGGDEVTSADYVYGSQRSRYCIVASRFR
jgi:formate/nitrite transporter FocA (FNT family)